MKTVVLLPIKHPSRAKSRLSVVLSQEERGALAWAMFEDICHALRHVPLPVVLVTDSETAAAEARKSGWKTLREREQVSESRSVDDASFQLSQEGFLAVLRLPGDVPLVQPSDVEQIHAALQVRPAAVAVPSRDGTGTNALLRAPADLFPSHFGPNSLSLHREEARRLSAQFTVVQNDRVALDLDEAGDLDAFFERGSDTHTQRLLTKIGWAERMAQRAEAHLHSRR